MSTFKPATPESILPSIVLVGLPGDGKTYTALQLATALAGEDGKVAVIDTEQSAAIYGGGKPFRFDVVCLRDFAPQQFIDKINAAEREGYDALVIDCLSDEYISKGGVLSIVHGHKNTTQGWGVATPQHSRLISAISGATIPIVATVGARVDDKGTIKPVQRADMMRAFHVGFDVSPKGMTVAHKTRYAALPLGKTLARDGAALALLLGNAVDAETQLARQKKRFGQEVIALYAGDGFKTMQDVAGLLTLAGVERYDPVEETVIWEQIHQYIAMLRDPAPATPKNGQQPPAEQPALFAAPDQTYQEA